MFVLVFRAGFFHPLTPDFDGTVRRSQPGIHGTERFDGGAPRVDASVLVLRFETQVKKGVLSKAFSTASNRLEVLPLVPMR